MPDDKNNVTILNVDQHPVGKAVDAMGRLEAPAFLLDGFMTEGMSMFSGERGAGKTSVMVPLAMAMGGLINDFPLKASIRRKVFYISEDIGQVRRIIAAIKKTGRLAVSDTDAAKQFTLVEAQLMTPAYICEAVGELIVHTTDNERTDGSIYKSPPVVVFDTTSSVIALDNISDNSEVAQAISLLRQKFGMISIVLVGHVAKATREKGSTVTALGAQAWEANTQQSIYLVKEGEERFIMLGKRRFEPDVTEYRVESYVSHFEAMDKLKRMVEVKGFFGIPKPTDREEKEQKKADVQARTKAKAWQGALDRTLAFITENPGQSTRVISESVMGNTTTIRAALAELVEQGNATVEEGPRGAKFHYPSK